MWFKRLICWIFGHPSKHVIEVWGPDWDGPEYHCPRCWEKLDV